MSEIEHRINGLVSGAAAWSGRGQEARADVALRTARAVADSAHAWVEAALSIKQSRAPAVRAEEMATGPLATLRLLLVTARALADIGRSGLPTVPRPPRIAHGGGGTPTRVEIDVVPALGPRRPLRDETIFGGVGAVVRCVNPGGVEAFMRSWREEAAARPRSGGVALVLGAGNVTGLAPADVVSQIFEHGRAVFLKLHPLQAELRPVLERALAPLVEARMLSVVAGGVEVVRAALAAPGLEHVHLTGGRSAFDAVVWGGRVGGDGPAIRQSVTCELGNVTPWFIVPGRYNARQLAFQADLVAASILNNTSFNCIATKLVVTARAWDQREEFLALVQRRLAAQPARICWYPGARPAWESLTGATAPADGTLPTVFRPHVDPERDPRFIDREWFVPVAAETPLTADSLEAFCVGAQALAARLPGSLAASVTMPATLPAHDAARVQLLVEHLPFGVVAVNTWSAIAYSLGSVPWGGLPGATLGDPRSGIGFVHDPLMLPLVHNTILRAPLTSRLTPAWVPWHRHGAMLAAGVVEMYAELARGRSGLWQLVRMLPAVMTANR